MLLTDGDGMNVPFVISTEVVTNEYIKVTWTTLSGIVLEFRIPDGYEKDEVLAFLTDIERIFHAGMDEFVAMSKESRT